MTVRGARSSHHSASCASSVLVSQEDQLPCPGSSMLLLGSLHSCFFSSHSVPCHLCGHTNPLHCPRARRRRGALPSGFAVGGPVASLCGVRGRLCGRARLARAVLPSLSVCLSVCVLLCWQQLLPLWACCLSLCSPGAGGAEGQRGSSRCHQPSPSQGSLQGLPSPPSPCYSSYLFIQMSECDEVQKRKLAPERP